MSAVLSIEAHPSWGLQQGTSRRGDGLAVPPLAGLVDLCRGRQLTARRSLATVKGKEGKSCMSSRRGGAILRLVANSEKPRAAKQKGAGKLGAPVAVPVPASARDEAEMAAEREQERRWCERAQAGDRQALAEILRKHGPLLYRTVLLPRLGSEAAAQDALADTYMRVLERFHQFEWRGCGVYPWLRVVAMRIALDALRSRKRETLFEPADLTRAVDAAERDLQKGLDVELCEKRDRAASRERLDRALAAINQRYAKAIRLRVLQEKSRDEAAAALGVTVPTFDVVLHRALSALRKAVHAEEVTA
jgi:RNA polymerase sigma factor (sigma-70 family)